ncbi:MAG: hypothetical protein KGH60_01215 [Candidatus Micrarchaeota archaeon]|nr:hypothetical protein [Candidatus Micrarchaeota archaeon]
MHIHEQLHRAWHLMTQPEKFSKVSFSVKDALKFYYVFSIVPVIISIIVAIIVGAATGIYVQGQTANSLALTGWLHSVAANLQYILPGFISAWTLLYFWIFVPIGLFINAAIYQLIGKMMLKTWKGNYSKSFTAAMFGVIPLTLFYFLSLIPGVNLVYLIVLPVWSIVILTISLAVQQKVTRTNAFVALLASWGLVALFLFLVAAATAAGVASTLGLYKLVL